MTLLLLWTASLLLIVTAARLQFEIRELRKEQSMAGTFASAVEEENETAPLVLTDQLINALQESTGNNPETNRWISVAISDALQNVKAFAPNVTFGIVSGAGNKWVAQTTTKDPLLEVVLESTINLPFACFDPPYGSFARHGFIDVDCVFIGDLKISPLAVWAGVTRPHRNFQQVLNQSAQKIREYFKRIDQELLYVREISSKHGTDKQTTLLQQVSHDIRSPLNNVRSILNIFRIEGLKEDSEQLLDVASKNIDIMSEILDTILEYSSQKAGHLEVFEEATRVDEILQEVLQSYEVSAKEKGLFLRGPCTEKRWICADKRHVKRVLGNLLSNAIKYSQFGTIEVSTREDEHFVFIAVKDSGIGMTEAQLSDLFIPFCRFNRTITDGVGLGLVVTKQLVETNGGSITVSSTYGIGSTFEVSFKKGVHESTACDEKRRPAVLVIDDDRSWGFSLRRALSRHGYEVSVATSLGEAQSLLALETFDAVLSDYEFEGAVPLTINQFLQSLSIPALVISGRQLQQSGFETMRKPVSIEEVINWIRTQVPVASDLLTAA